MNPEKQTKKKIYKKPEVTVHGNIETITQTGGITQITDVPKGSLLGLT
jgi:hypothetical protein